MVTGTHDSWNGNEIGWYARLAMQSIPLEQWPRTIALVVFDFDGVMTDNTVEVSADGTETVRCHRSDGLGIDRMRAAGIPMMVLSTEKHPVVAVRCEKLRIPCHQGISDKAMYLQQYAAKQKIALQDIAFVGNDENDLSCLNIVGLPVVVADAYPSLLPYAKVILKHQGGKGAVREFCDAFLAARGMH